MSFLRKIYDATSKSSSKLGKIGKWAYPFNGQYFIRDAWRKYGKKYLTPASGSTGNFSVNSAGTYGATGSIVGKY